MRKLWAICRSGFLDVRKLYAIWTWLPPITLGTRNTRTTSQTYSGNTRTTSQTNPVRFVWEMPFGFPHCTIPYVDVRKLYAICRSGFVDVRKLYPISRSGSLAVRKL